MPSLQTESVSTQVIPGRLFFVSVLNSTPYLLVNRPRKLAKLMRFLLRRFSLWKKASFAGIPGFDVQLIETLQKILVDRLVQRSLYFRKQCDQIVDIWYPLLPLFQQCLEAFLDTLLRPDAGTSEVPRRKYSWGRCERQRYE